MGPAAKTTTMRSISQEAFEELVNENIDDLGMDPTEALQDAIQTLTLQGVDLSGQVLLLFSSSFSLSLSPNLKTPSFRRHRHVRPRRNQPRHRVLGPLKTP